MYSVEFHKDTDNPDSYNKVFVHTYVELLQLLNYIDKFEYHLESVVREDMLIGYDSFKEFAKSCEKPSKKGTKNDSRR